MIKVHYAGMDGDVKVSIAAEIANLNYSLYSVLKYIYNKKDPLKLPRNDGLIIQQKNCKHVIQDSGLYTLMFGAKKGTPVTKQYLLDWQDRLIEFVQINGITAACVDIDCQKILGVKDAWFFRERMRNKLKNEQINVFHYEDGKDGLDELIRFSDYIAISVPEIRIIKGKTYKEDVHYLAQYIKSKKPEIKIHLLGCTELKMLRENNFCTSADSSSWLYGIKHNCFYSGSYTVKREEISPALIKSYKKKVISLSKKYGRELTQKGIEYTALLGINGKMMDTEIRKIVGNQD